MAQIAIPLLLVGTAYLVSNDKNDENETENFSNIDDSANSGDLRYSNLTNGFSPNVSETELNVNNEKKVSTFQDKYYLSKNVTTPSTPVSQNSNINDVYENLAGNQVTGNDFKHNNMNVYYNNKSNGHSTSNYEGVLDAYTGQGTFDIKKEEVASFFKPEDNLQNVYGNPNHNDFMQGRVNASLRHANTKPFESIQDTPGIGLDYTQKSELGFNTGAMQRDMWQPKNVDELRAANNPKTVYRLDDHMGPALNPIQNRGIQGKVIKKRPEGFFSNDNNLGMIAGASGAKNMMQKPEQMLPEENRQTTSVSYYGSKSGGENLSYVDGEYMDAHKQQLCGTPFINFSKNGVNPTNDQNYGREGFSSLPNNRSTTRDNYFGGITGMVKNVVQPIVNGLRHTKKTNFNESKQGGNVSGVVANPRAVNNNERLNTTNREMYECKLGMDHLNVQKQDSTAYMNTRPVLNITQRSSMNQGELGPAASSNKGNRSYDAEYKQRNNDRLHAKDVRSGGNMNLFNNQISMQEFNKEHCNNRSTPFHNPNQNLNYNNPKDLIGSFSSMPQDYEERTSNRIDGSMLNAFKNNPYTQPLNSVA